MYSTFFKYISEPKTFLFETCNYSHKEKSRVAASLLTWSTRRRCATLNATTGIPRVHHVSSIKVATIMVVNRFA